MKLLALMTFLIASSAFAQSIPSSALPASCKLKSEYKEVSQIDGVRLNKQYSYRPEYCLTIRGTSGCISYFAAMCTVDREEISAKLSDGSRVVYQSVDDICNEFSNHHLKGEKVKCESKMGRTLSFGGNQPSCNDSSNDLEITVLKKLSGEDLKQAKCEAITSCLENGLGYLERRSAGKWANYYECQQ